jgi:hypothetical protein
MEDIKVGDWMVISGYPAANERLLRQVLAVTPKQFTCDSIKFWKATGYSVGKDAFGQHKTATFASEDQVQEYLGLREKKALIKTIQRHLQEFQEIPIEVLEVVVNLLES